MVAPRQRRLSLDGVWWIELEPGAQPLPIRVPFTFESPLSGIGLGREVHELIRCRHRFEVPRAWRGSRVLLHFGAVDWRASVRLDGELLGSHTGGYTHFAFDLGELEVASEHELIVEVQDPAEGFQPRGKQRGSGGIWYTRTTGIWQRVWLEAVPAVYVRSFGVETPAVGTVRVQVETNEPTEVTVRLGTAEARFAAPGEAVLRLDEPRLWTPERPAMYDVGITTATGDALAVATGFRSIEARDTEILLNGEPTRLSGVLDQGFWPDGVYTPPSEGALRADVEAAKALGFNLVRKHVKVEDPRWYDWCDRLGLLVAQDIPSSHDLSGEAGRTNFAAEVEEIVRQLRGHPSIVMWILFNEDWGKPPPDFQRELVRRVRGWDPTRLVVDASGWTQLDDTDLVDVHDYGDDLSAHRNETGRPLWLGECGGVSFPADSSSEDFAYKHAASGDELASAYARLVGGIGDVAGFVWTQLADVEGELNGLLTAGRVPKVDVGRINDVNARFRGSGR